MKPSKSDLPLPTVLYVSENGKDSAIVEEDKKGELLTLAQQGFAVCAIGLRGQGETSPSFPQAGPLWYYPGGGKELRQDYAWASLILGNPVLGQQVWDLLRCMDFLATRRDVEILRLHVAGVGGGALTALLGAVLDERPASILCDHMLADYLSVVESEDYNVELSWLVPGILKELDMPELVQALAPRRLTLLNAVGPRGEVLSKPDLQAKFRVATEAYSRAGAGDNLVLDNQPEEEPLSRVFSRWLGKS
jgi:hypothetical protein